MAYGELPLTELLLTCQTGINNYVVVDGCCSSSLAFTCGVPQGSILAEALRVLKSNGLSGIRPSCTISSRRYNGGQTVIIRGTFLVWLCKCGRQGPAR